MRASIRLVKTATNLLEARDGDDPAEETRKIWRTFEGCGPISYCLWVRIASHALIQAHIRSRRELEHAKI